MDPFPRGRRILLPEDSDGAGYPRCLLYGNPEGRKAGRFRGFRQALPRGADRLNFPCSSPAHKKSPFGFDPEGAAFYSELILVVPLRLEALTAVHGPISAGLEGNLGGAAATVADHFVHLTGAVAAVLSPTGSTAGGAAAGLILEALLGEKRLLAGGENEFVAAVTAGQRLVFIHGEKTSLKMLFDPRLWTFH